MTLLLLYNPFIYIYMFLQTVWTTATTHSAATIDLTHKEDQYVEYCAKEKRLIYTRSREAVQLREFFVINGSDSAAQPAFVSCHLWYSIATGRHWSIFFCYLLNFLKWPRWRRHPRAVFCIFLSACVWSRIYARSRCAKSKPVLVSVSWIPHNF